MELYCGRCCVGLLGVRWITTSGSGTTGFLVTGSGTIGFLVTGSGTNGFLVTGSGLSVTSFA